jgi:hypothetical protein
MHFTFDLDIGAFFDLGIPLNAIPNFDICFLDHIGKINFNHQ